MSNYVTFWEEKKAPKELLRTPIKINGHLMSELQKTICYNRGFDTAEKIKRLINFSKADIPTVLPVDMAKCASVVIEHLKNGHVVQYGDYDVDGAGTIIIFVRAMRRAGFKVGYWTNTRTMGFGMKKEGIDGILAKAPKTTLILTSDNGIVHFEACEYAYEKGLKVCITDHHEPNADGTLPRAEAVVDCKRHDEVYPFKECCGTAIVFKLCQEIYRQLGLNPDDLDDMLDIVALATVADVVPIVEENRYYLQKGLEIMNGHSKGYWEYIKKYVLSFDDRIATSTIGFSIAPLINACSRINSTINIPLEFFLMEDSFPISNSEYLDNEYEEEYTNDNEGHLDNKDVAVDLHKRKLLKKMVDTNALRKEFTDVYTRNLNIQANKNYDDNAFVLWAENFHTGIMGISAGRICELSHRPTLCMTNDILHPDVFVGSGRAPKGANLIKALQEIDAENKDIFIAYGGHPGACGFSIKRENLQKLHDELNKKISSDFRDNETVYYDARIKANANCAQIYEEVSELGPFGFGFEAPLFLIEELPFMISYPQEEPKHFRFSSEFSDINIWNIYETWKAVGFADVKSCLAELDCIKGGKVQFTARKGMIAWNVKADD